MVTDENNDGNVWAVREAFVNLLELVDSAEPVELSSCVPREPGFEKLSKSG